MKRVALLAPYAPSYREGIYKLMDSRLDIDWYFCGNAKRPLKLLDYSCLRNCNLNMQEKSLFARIGYYKGLRRIDIDQYDYLIIAGVIRNISEWWLLLRYAGKSKGPKVFLWTHGIYGYEGFVQRSIKKFFFNRADGLFLYGNYAKRLLLQNGIDERKISVIHNSLDYDKQLNLRNKVKSTSMYPLYFGNSNQVILFIGRLSKVKKLDQLIEAVALLKISGEDYNIVLVGDGEERNNLEIKVKELGMQSNVWFYGECFDEETNAELVFNADLCVAPGNIGLTAMHALMFGCPALSHNDFCWQMPEFESIRPGETGDFFKSNDVGDMAGKISKWFEGKKGQREQIRQACYKEIDDSWNPYYQLGVINKAFMIE